MKKLIGLVLFLIVLVVVSGCTQPAKTSPAATTAPTEVPPVETTVETTVAPTPIATTEATAVPTTEVNATLTTVPEANTTVVVPETTAIVTAAMTPSTKVTVIHIANGTFSPSPLMVLPGTRITWVNDDATVHSVKMIGTHAGKFNSGDISPKSQWGYDFNQDEDTYEYADGYNMNITGIVIVKKGESLVGNVVMMTPYVTSNASW